MDHGKGIRSKKKKRIEHKKSKKKREYPHHEYHELLQDEELHMHDHEQYPWVRLMLHLEVVVDYQLIINVPLHEVDTFLSINDHWLHVLIFLLVLNEPGKK